MNRETSSPLARGARLMGPPPAAVPLDLVVLTIRLIEIATVLGGGVIALYLWGEVIPGVQLGDYLRVVAASALFFALIAEVLGAYDVDAQFSLRVGWQRVLLSWLVAVLLLISTAFILKVSAEFSRGWTITNLVTTTVMLAGIRAGATLWVRRLKRQGVFDSRAVIFGAGLQGQRVASYIRGNPRLTISLLGFFDDRRDGRVPVVVDDLPVFGNVDDLVEAIRDGHIDQVIVALPWSAEARIREVVGKLALTPVRIRLAPDLATFSFLNRPIVLLGDLPVLNLFERPISGLDAIVKRVEDLVITIPLLVLLSPVFLLTAIAIKLDSPGPVFFRQPREGFNNRLFEVLKFRSMAHDACETHDIRQATRGDRRVTRVGAFIRRTSIDELPQLINVLKGEMSLVGPRPHAPSTRAGGRLFHEVVHTYAARHKVKPGITGWAQVCGFRGETDTEDKLIRRIEHDLYYIENWSVAFDIYILLRTVFAVLLPRNAF
ncbi:MAG: undecaprenyl-phosphate glucose phosphotransferase [Sphingomonadaceae bacterium]|uniref:undecaprenyl-phosphate glucose phosphotransferase n=1 Tax=Thermaurantiacus sp. TaxID=2820283 RepID=UPI00298ED90F|nr:undecaprenyl-phosphate glucose phosphotransferase [Thermaurantiacus sp.]MCS6986088.1 undecaprenyl-phosphate glucose phosphotransferase [Sphingomonadaceae bacterium]MDW8414696.1 undecaprenyl-phosphate glucose phosphotransferase [Thermaurantiacus sp.]